MIILIFITREEEENTAVDRPIKNQITTIVVSDQIQTGLVFFFIIK